MVETECKVKMACTRYGELFLLPCIVQQDIQRLDNALICEFKSRLGPQQFPRGLSLQL